MNIELGEVSITVDEKIIFVKSIGAFNALGTKKYTDGIKTIVNNFQGQGFSILINNLEKSGSTPEAYQALDKFNKWLTNQNLIAKAMVITVKKGMHLVNTPARINNQQNKLFDNEGDAIKWLESFS